MLFRRREDLRTEGHDDVAEVAVGQGEDGHEDQVCGVGLKENLEIKSTVEHDVVFLGGAILTESS